MVAFAPVAESSSLHLAGRPEQSRRLPASPGVSDPRYIDAPVCRDEDKNSDGNWTAFKNDGGPGDGGGGSWDLEQERDHNDVNEIDTDNDHTTGPHDDAITEGASQPAWISPKYDAAGNIIEGPSAPRPGGGDDPEETRHKYTYDAWNRLVKATDNSDNTIAEYRYDGLHRRIRKFLPDGDDWTVKEYYYNLGWQVLEVRKEDGKARTGTPIPEPSLAAHWYERYTWSPRYIDALIARQRDADGDAQHTLEESLFYTHDANMNVTAVVNTSREVVERYMYDAYGKVTVLDGSTGGQTDWDTDADGKSDVDNEILYGGYRFDTETGLYHVRHRMYHPTLGRWMQRDPSGYVGGMALYEYVAGRPIVLLDPSGLRARPRPVEFEPGLGTVSIPVLEDIAVGLMNMGQAVIVWGLTGSEQPELPPPSSGSEFASYELCCLCIDAAIRQRNYAEKRGEAYMANATNPNIRTVKDLEKAVHGEGGAMGPGVITGETGPFGSKVYPRKRPCGELLTQATAEHERSHWEDRNDLLAQSQAGIRGILSAWPSALGGGDKYFWALTEAGACDAEVRFLDEFIQACQELGLGD